MMIISKRVTHPSIPLFYLALMIGCDGDVKPAEILETDIGQIFYEPTLDMTIIPDLGDDVETRILGEFGDTCERNFDCAEQWCIDAGEENICTRTCLGDDCPSGWSCRAVSNNTQDVTLICVPQEERLCKRCESDRDCPTGLCYLLDGEQICGSDCMTDEDCPANYTCSEKGPEGETLCTPLSASCSCNTDREGEVRICESSSNAGSCFGRQSCEGTLGWTSCSAPVPTVEICNQIDDDCNGITDDISNIGEGCYEEAMIDGELRRCDGIFLCIEGEDLPQCSAQAPSVELCNFKDDDCDGTIDEGFEGREEACAVGVGICQRYGVLVCNDTPRPEMSDEMNEVEWTPLVCNASEGEPSVERCDGLDNDCDGLTDEDYPTLGEICTVGEGLCRQSSVTRCDPSGEGVFCEVSAGLGDIERCDGIDNDCDGLVDEDYPELNELCSAGVGACERRGLNICAPNGETLVCSVSAAESGLEVCDGLDNDCDGQVDEEHPNLNSLCSVGQGRCQRSGVYVCDPNNRSGAVECSAELVVGNPIDTCDYQDDDCDGSIDEDYITNGEYTSLSHCGSCGSDCLSLWQNSEIDYNVTPTCATTDGLTQCGYLCLEGFFDLDGLSNNGCEFSPDPLSIYVKPPQYGGINNEQCGSFNQACATITYGIQIAQTQGKSRVRVSEGVYRELIEVPNGFELLGGHQETSWVRSPSVSTSHIDTRGLNSPDQHRYGLIARDIDLPTTIDGFLITAGSPLQAGNSYGIYIIDSDDKLRITNNRIVAGDGGRGLDGQIGGNGSNGLAGQSGNSSYGVINPFCGSILLNVGGQGGQQVCNGMNVSGGRGAGSLCPVFDEPVGLADDGEGPSGGGAGVTAWSWRSSAMNRCIVSSGPRDPGTGGVGATGNDGAGGTAAIGTRGSTTNSHWRGFAGGDGDLAQTGSGGGGGGAAAGIVIEWYFEGDGYDIGASGGGGGGGGCGGIGGLGGQAGGGSFGVYLTYSSPVANEDTLPILIDNTITRGFGGVGGTGGAGGPGGRGGLPGLGGTPGAENTLFMDFCSLNGGDGGKGGDGGSGGGGAGGNGGVSYDFYLHNTEGQSRDYPALNLSLVGETETGGSGGVGGVSPNIDIGTGERGMNGASGASSIE